MWVGADYEDLLAAADPAPLATAGASTPGIVLYTSGTTGALPRDPNGKVRKALLRDRERGAAS